jgi:hypothetical protein
MDTKQNNKKNQPNKGLFSFLFREPDRRQEKDGEAYALCAPSPGLNGPGVNCVLVDENRRASHSLRD